MKVVNVTLTGPGNSGKKAVGELLHTLLIAAGFSVDMSDETYAEKTASDVGATLARLSRENVKFVIEYGSADEV
jgi:hypothetical protein